MTLLMDKDVAEVILLSRFPTTNQKCIAQSTPDWEGNTTDCCRKQIIINYLWDFNDIIVGYISKLTAIALGITDFDEAPTQSSVSVLKGE